MIPFLTRPFRRRLTLAFFLVAAVTASTVALVALVSVNRYRMRTFKSRAKDETKLTLQLIPNNAGDGQLEQLLTVARTRSNVETIAVTRTGVLLSDSLVTLDRVPSGLRDAAGRGDVQGAEVRIVGSRYYVVGGRDDGGTQIFIFFSMRTVLDSLHQVTVIIVASALGVIVLAALVGSAAARRTLAPVRRAAAAARQVAEDCTGTELPGLPGDEFASWEASFNSIASALGDHIRELSMAREREHAFTSDVAHELRTPVASLLAAASMLAEDVDDLPVSQRRTVELLVGEARRLRSLLDEVMDLSRFDAGVVDVRTEAVDVAALVSSVVYGSGLGERVRLDLDEAAAETDRRRLERIVANLVSNADRHGSVDVEVAVRNDGDAVVVLVRDRGPGIAPAHLGRIFDRFYKADPSRTGTSTGVGLAIAAENTKAIAADLSASNREGGGCEFRLAIPRNLTPRSQREGSQAPARGFATPASG